jgi:hypothetical protein
LNDGLSIFLTILSGSNLISALFICLSKSATFFIPKFFLVEAIAKSYGSSHSKSFPPIFFTFIDQQFDYQAQ